MVAVLRVPGIVFHRLNSAAGCCGGTTKELHPQLKSAVRECCLLLSTGPVLGLGEAAVDEGWPHHGEFLFEVPVGSPSSIREFDFKIRFLPVQRRRGSF
jgi:hypothetical protein